MNTHGTLPPTALTHTHHSGYPQNTYNIIPRYAIYMLHLSAYLTYAIKLYYNCLAEYKCIYVYNIRTIYVPHIQTVLYNADCISHYTIVFGLLYIYRLVEYVCT